MAENAVVELAKGTVDTLKYVFDSPANGALLLEGLPYSGDSGLRRPGFPRGFGCRRRLGRLLLQLRQHGRVHAAVRQSGLDHPEHRRGHGGRRRRVRRVRRGRRWCSLGGRGHDNRRHSGRRQWPTTPPPRRAQPQGVLPRRAPPRRGGRRPRSTICRARAGVGGRRPSPLLSLGRCTDRTGHLWRCRGCLSLLRPLARSTRGPQPASSEIRLGTLFKYFY